MKRYCVLIIHSSVYRHIGCSNLLSIVTRSEMSIGEVHISDRGYGVLLVHEYEQHGWIIWQIYYPFEEPLH